MKKSFLFLFFFLCQSCIAKPGLALKMQDICSEKADFVSSWVVGDNGDKIYSVTWFSLSKEKAILCVTEKEAGIEKMLSKDVYNLLSGNQFVSGACTLNGEPNNDIFVEGVAIGDGEVGADIKIRKAWKFDVQKRALIEINVKTVSCVLS